MSRWTHARLSPEDEILTGNRGIAYRNEHGTQLNRLRFVKELRVCLSEFQDSSRPLVFSWPSSAAASDTQVKGALPY